MALGNEPRFLAYGADSAENPRPLPVSPDGLTIPVSMPGMVLPDQTMLKTVDFTAAGDVNVWTPAAGKAIVILFYDVELSGNASALAVNGEQLVRFKSQIGQGAATLLPIRHVFFVPTLGPNVPPASRAGRELAYGYRLPADASLVVNLSHALTAGRYFVTVTGYEV